jgi:hypothetical protein
MHVFTLCAVGLLLVAFKSTRLTGIAGLTLLSLMYPPLFVAFLIVSLIAFIFYLRSKKNGLPGLPARRD